MRAFMRSVDIGNVMLKMGLVTTEQLQQAVKRQANEDRGTRLGEVMVGMGVITRKQLEEALAKQKAMRSGKAVDVMLEMVDSRLPELLKHG